MLVFGFIIAEGVQHIILVIAMKFVIKGMKDFDPDTWEPNNRTIVQGFYPNTEDDLEDDLEDNLKEEQSEETKETINK